MNTPAPVDLGAMIDRFIDRKGDGHTPNLSGFYDFLKQQTGMGSRLLPQALGLERGTMANWQREGSTLNRKTLDALSTSFHLTPLQELRLWSIGCGDLNAPSVSDIAAQLTHGTTKHPHPPQESQRGEHRVATISALCRHTGLSRNKILDMAGYSKPVGSTLFDASKSFHNLQTARDIATVFSPDHAPTADAIALQLLGFTERYNAEQFATMATDGGMSMPDVLALARIQRCHTVQQAADSMGIPYGTYQRWERQPTQISDVEYADALANYMGAQRGTDSYIRLNRALMGSYYVPYVEVSAPPLPSPADAPHPAITGNTRHQGTLGAPPIRSVANILAELFEARGASPSSVSRDCAAIGIRLPEARIAAFLDGSARPSMTEQTGLVTTLKLSRQQETELGAACAAASAGEGRSEGRS